MPDLTFKLDEAMVRDALQEALLTCLKPAERDKLVGEAVRELVKGSWTAPSELERIFRRAAESVALDLAKAEFSKPENVERIRAIVVDAWEKATQGDGREKIVARAAEAITRGLFGERY